MNFKDEEEVKQFIEIATRIRMLQQAGEPIPLEVKEMILNNKHESEVFFVLSEMLNNEWKKYFLFYVWRNYYNFIVTYRPNDLIFIVFSRFGLLYVLRLIFALLFLQVPVLINRLIWINNWFCIIIILKNNWNTIRF